MVVGIDFPKFVRIIRKTWIMNGSMPKLYEFNKLCTIIFH